MGKLTSTSLLYIRVNLYFPIHMGKNKLYLPSSRVLKDEWEGLGPTCYTNMLLITWPWKRTKLLFPFHFLDARVTFKTKANHRA